MFRFFCNIWISVPICDRYIAVKTNIKELYYRFIAIEGGLAIPNGFVIPDIPPFMINSDNMAFFIYNLISCFFCMNGIQQYCMKRTRGLCKRRWKFQVGFNCWFSFAPVFQWCCSAPRGSPGVGRNTFLSSPHLCFIIVLICDLFVSRGDPLMS